MAKKTAKTLKEKVEQNMADKNGFKFKPDYVFGILAGITVLIFDFLLFSQSSYFVPIIGIAIVIGSSQMWGDYFTAIKKEREMEEKFPEFVRNLVEAIKSGLSVSAAIEHVSDINYGALSFHVRKLSNQISWSMPLHKALIHFANGTNNKMIKRAIATVIEAKESGGSLEEVLETITTSVVEIKKIKDKRRANVFSQVMQNYFIFFVFITVMIVIQNVLMPYVSNIGDAPGGVQGNGIPESVDIDLSSPTGFIISMTSWFLCMNGIFLMITLIQGFFAGIVIGKLSEGNIKYGFKHSFILMVLGFMIMSLAQGL